MPTAEDILRQYAKVFKPGSRKTHGTPTHVELDPSFTPVNASTRRVPAAKLDWVNEGLKRLFEKGISTNMLGKEKPNDKFAFVMTQAIP